MVLSQLEAHESLLSKARKLFVAGKLKFDDFSQIKRESQEYCGSLKKELDTINKNLAKIDKQSRFADHILASPFDNFINLDLVTKKQIVEWIRPSSIDLQAGQLSIVLNHAVGKILMQ